MKSKIMKKVVAWLATVAMTMQIGIVMPIGANAATETYAKQTIAADSTIMTGFEDWVGEGRFGVVSSVEKVASSGDYAIQIAKAADDKRSEARTNKTEPIDLGQSSKVSMDFKMVSNPKGSYSTPVELTVGNSETKVLFTLRRAVSGAGNSAELVAYSGMGMATSVNQQWNKVSAYGANEFLFEKKEPVAFNTDEANTAFKSNDAWYHLDAVSVGDTLNLTVYPTADSNNKKTLVFDTTGMKKDIKTIRGFVDIGNSGRDSGSYVQFDNVEVMSLAMPTVAWEPTIPETASIGTPITATATVSDDTNVTVTSSSDAIATAVYAENGLTITPVAEGTATVTVTATKTGATSDPTEVITQAYEITVTDPSGVYHNIAVNYKSGDAVIYSDNTGTVKTSAIEGVKEGETATATVEQKIAEFDGYLLENDVYNKYYFTYDAAGTTDSVLSAANAAIDLKYTKQAYKTVTVKYVDATNTETVLKTQKTIVDQLEGTVVTADAADKANITIKEGDIPKKECVYDATSTDNVTVTGYGTEDVITLKFNCTDYGVITVNNVVDGVQDPIKTYTDYAVQGTAYNATGAQLGYKLVEGKYYMPKSDATTSVAVVEAASTLNIAFEEIKTPYLVYEDFENMAAGEQWGFVPAEGKNIKGANNGVFTITSNMKDTKEYFEEKALYVAVSGKDKITVSFKWQSLAQGAQGRSSGFQLKDATDNLIFEIIGAGNNGVTYATTGSTQAIPDSKWADGARCAWYTVTLELDFSGDAGVVSGTIATDGKEPIVIESTAVPATTLSKLVGHKIYSDAQQNLDNFVIIDNTPATYTVTGATDANVTAVKLTQGGEDKYTGVIADNVVTFDNVLAGTYDAMVTYADGFMKADDANTTVTVTDANVENLKFTSKAIPANTFTVSGTADAHVTKVELKKDNVVKYTQTPVAETFVVTFAGVEADIYDVVVTYATGYEEGTGTTKTVTVTNANVADLVFASKMSAHTVTATVDANVASVKLVKSDDNTTEIAGVIEGTKATFASVLPATYNVVATYSKGFVAADANTKTVVVAVTGQDGAVSVLSQKEPLKMGVGTAEDPYVNITFEGETVGNKAWGFVNGGTNVTNILSADGWLTYKVGSGNRDGGTIAIADETVNETNNKFGKITIKQFSDADNGREPSITLNAAPLFSSVTDGNEMVYKFKFYAASGAQGTIRLNDGTDKVAGDVVSVDVEQYSKDVWMDATIALNPTNHTYLLSVNDKGTDKRTFGTYSNTVTKVSMMRFVKGVSNGNSTVQVDDIKIYQEAPKYKYANVTVNYVDGEGNVLKPAEKALSVVGEGYTVAADKYAAFDLNNLHYTFNAEKSKITLASVSETESENVLNVVFDKTAYIEVTINNKVAEQVIKTYTDKVLEGSNYTATDSVVGYKVVEDKYYFPVSDANLTITNVTNDNRTLDIAFEETTKPIIAYEDFNNIAKNDKWGFVNSNEKSMTGVDGGKLVITSNGSTTGANDDVKALDAAITAEKNLNVSFKWMSGVDGGTNRTSSFDLQDASGNVIFSIFGTGGVGKDAAGNAGVTYSVGETALGMGDADKIKGIFISGSQWAAGSKCKEYTVNLTMDFADGKAMIAGTISADGVATVSIPKTEVTATNLGKLVGHQLYSLASQYIDNISIERRTPPVVYAVSGTADANVTKVSLVEDGIVKYTATNIADPYTVSFDNVEAGTYSIVATYATGYEKADDADTTVTVTDAAVSGLKFTSKQSETPVPTAPFEVVKDNGTVTVKALEAAKAGEIYVATYTNGVMTSVKKADAPTEVDATATVTYDAQSQDVRIFVWNSDMAPYKYVTK